MGNNCYNVNHLYAGDCDFGASARAFLAKLEGK